MSFLKCYVGCQHYRVLLEGGTPRQARYEVGALWAGAVWLNVLAIGLVIIGSEWFPMAQRQWLGEFFILDQDDVLHISRLVLTLGLALGGLIWLFGGSSWFVAFQRAALQEFLDLETPAQLQAIRSLLAFRLLVFGLPLLLYFFIYKRYLLGIG